MPASVEIAKETLRAGGLILAIGTVTGRLAQKIGVPDVAVFLIVEIVINRDSVGEGDSASTGEGAGAWSRGA